MKNKKGLSGIVTALILVILVLVAAGIVYVVYNDLIKASEEDIALASKCLKVVIDAEVNTVTDCTPVDTPVVTHYTCDVKLERSTLSSGDDLDGVKIIFLGNQDNSDGVYYTSSVSSKTTAIDISTDPIDSRDDITDVIAIPYFLKENGEKYVCRNA